MNPVRFLGLALSLAACGGGAPEGTMQSASDASVDDAGDHQDAREVRDTTTPPADVMNDGAAEGDAALKGDGADRGVVCRDENGICFPPCMRVEARRVTRCVSLEMIGCIPEESSASDAPACVRNLKTGEYYTLTAGWSLPGYRFCTEDEFYAVTHSGVGWCDAGK